MSTNFMWKTLMVLPFLSILAAELSQSNEKFSNCTIGKSFAHKNTAGRWKMLICAENINGVPQWQYTDGSSTFGEVFNPAQYCSDIVDYLPEAKDGFYWIILDNTTKKVWCDVHTDGGGFMLVGMKDSPKSWTVPSNFTPVDPLGPPHWSSVLGNITVLDFRVQFSTDNSFKGTKADWTYRLEPTRELGNLFSANNGCPYLQAGITNISFVKDLLTQTEVTHSFKCAKFGQNVHHMLGWEKMNKCLRKVCKHGYAVPLQGAPIVFDRFGSFSYSAVSSYSGMDHDSTAFVGCDHGKCCACFGPKGGRQNYCGRRCTAFRGGTVINNAFVWFWVRSRMPTRLWERCMEFTVKDAAGKEEKRFIDPKTGTAHKASCSKHSKTKVYFNEGSLTVSDKESLQSIPHVPGLLLYRKDNKRLYVNQGSHWQPLSSKHEQRDLKQEVKRQEITIGRQQNEIHTLQTKIQAQENVISNLKKEFQGLVNRTDKFHPPMTCSSLLQRYPATPSGNYDINPDGLVSSPTGKVYCDMTSKNGAGVTVIGHNSESWRYVQGYEDPGSYTRYVYYDILMKQIVAIIKQSENCEQFIRYQCYGSVMMSEDGPYAWWVSRQGWIMNYWGGAAINSGKCACGMTNWCAGEGNCNCDKNDETWREDRGYLTDKNTLPVIRLKFGDTGSSSEQGYTRLGKLRCWG